MTLWAYEKAGVHVPALQEEAARHASRRLENTGRTDTNIYIYIYIYIYMYIYIYIYIYRVNPVCVCVCI